MEANEKGKLIVSTKSNAGGRKILLVICSAIMFLYGLVFLLTPGGIEIFGETFFGYIFSMLCIGVSASCLIVGFRSLRSYCDVYEYCVSGMTGLSVSNPSAPMQNFEIVYDDIMNVTESGKSILIYTQYAKYEVVALVNRQAAIKEIRSRIQYRDKRI